MDELKKRLLEAADEQKVPDVRLEVIEKYEARKAKKKVKAKRSLIWGTALPVLAGGFAILAVVIVSPWKQPETPPNPSSSVPPIINVEKKTKDVGVSILYAFNSLHVDTPLRMMTLKAPLPDDQFNEKAKILNDYTLTAEELLSNSMSLQPTVAENSDDSEFEYTMHIKNGREEIVFLFSDYPLQNEDEDEEEFEIRGEFTKNGQTFTVTGEREKEVDEYEIEMVFSDNDGHKILEMKQEQENGEDGREISFETKEFNSSGEETGFSKISYEEEDGHFVDIEVDDDFFTVSRENEETLRIKYELKGTEDGYSGDWTATIVDDGAYYLYEEATTEASTKLPRA